MDDYITADSPPPCRPTAAARQNGLQSRVPLKCSRFRGFYPDPQGHGDFLGRPRFTHSRSTRICSDDKTGVAGCQFRVRSNATKRDGKSTLGYRDHEQIPKRSASVGRIWRMLMVEECRLRLVVNSASGRRGGLCGRRRGGVVAPIATRGSFVLIVSGLPAATIREVLRNDLKGSNPRLIQAVGLVQPRLSCTRSEAMGSNRRRKGVKQSHGCHR